MFGMNRVFLFGRLGQDPEICTSKNGTEYTKLAIATPGYSKKKEDGTWENKTEWHDVSVWGRKAQTCRKHLRKGSAVLVEGTISNVEFVNAQGAKTRRPWIRAIEVEFFPPARKSVTDELTDGPPSSL
jgi:single-strand DNA-binding protein